MADHSVHLLALRAGHTIEALHSIVSSPTSNALVTARVEYWLTAPLSEALKNSKWDVFLWMPNTDPLPEAVRPMIEHQWSMNVQTAEEMAVGFDALTRKLKNTTALEIPALHGTDIKISGAEDEELEVPITPELKNFFETFSKGRGAGNISMLNLLAFNPGKKEQFMGYIPVFTETLGPKHGSIPKLLGGRVETDSIWDNVALVHYPSIQHFAELVASDEYKFYDKKHKVGTLKDTGLCCLTEL